MAEGSVVATLRPIQPATTRPRGPERSSHGRDRRRAGRDGPGALDRGRVTYGRVAREPAPPPPHGSRPAWTLPVPGSRGPGRDGPRERHGEADGPGMRDDDGGPAPIAKVGPRRRDPRSEVGGSSPPGQSIAVTPRARAAASFGFSAVTRRTCAPRRSRIGLLPALVDFHARDPGRRRDDLRGGAGAAGRAPDDQGLWSQRRLERRGKRTRLPRTRPSRGGSLRPQYRRPDQVVAAGGRHDLGHASPPGGATSGPETAADSKVAIPSRIGRRHRSARSRAPHRSPRRAGGRGPAAAAARAGRARSRDPVRRSDARR